MNAVQFREFGGAIEIAQTPRPSAPAGGVVIKVEAAGLCRSDWHAWQGHDRDIETLPHCPGHEFAGTVAELGDDVSGWAIGDRVTAPFVCGCGSCAQCESGNSQVCPNQYQPGFTGPGAFAEFVSLPFANTNLVRLPAAVAFEEAAALGCRFATAFRALAHQDQANVRRGERLAVFGCGGVGLSAVMIGAALGAEVIAIDIREDALARALELGAERAVHFRDAAEVTAEVSVDALGSAETCAASMNALTPRGRHVQIGLLVGGDAQVSLPIGRMIAEELQLIGSHGMSATRYPEMLRMVGEGKLCPAALIGRRIGLAELPEAMAEMSDFGGTVGTTVITKFT